MALTITSPTPLTVGNRRGVIATIAFDSSYPTGGGEPLTASDFGFVSTIDEVDVNDTSGYSFKYDIANSKLLAYTAFNTYTATLDIASLATDAIADNQVTVTGALTTDIVEVLPPHTLEAGIIIQQAWVSATNTIQVRVSNTSAGTVDAASGTFTFNLRNASGALKQVKNATDLSALTGVQVFATGS